MVIHKISDTDNSTFIGMNGGMIESPDGKRIIYAQKPQLDKPDNMQMWICDADMTNHRCIYTGECMNHNGPSATFIDSSTVVFRDMAGGSSAIVIMDTDTLDVKYKIYGKEGHRAEGSIYPFSITDEHKGKNSAYPDIKENGIYTLDIATGKIKLIVSAEQIIDMVKEHGLTPKPNTASVSHVQLNPSATSVMMRLGVEDCPVFGALGCVDIQSGKTHMIADKPVHQLWYDDETYMATRQFYIESRIDMATSYIARFSKDGEEIEVLGGIGNHIDGSPDRTMFTGDRCYPGYAPDIYVYEKGSKKPVYTVEMNDLQNVIWKLQVHPNPSFSQNGKRIYFNRPVSETKTEASYIEL